MKRWQEMTRDELLDAIAREHGHRLSLADEVRRLRELTKDKRDDLAIIRQLTAEVDRLTSQSAPNYWKGAYENQLRLKRSVKRRLDVALAGLQLATLWLRHFDGDGPEPDAPVADVLAAWHDSTRVKARR